MCCSHSSISNLTTTTTKNTKTMLLNFFVGCVFVYVCVLQPVMSVSRKYAIYLLNMEEKRKFTRWSWHFITFEPKYENIQWNVIKRGKRRTFLIYSHTCKEWRDWIWVLVTRMNHSVHNMWYNFDSFNNTLSGVVLNIFLIIFRFSSIV